MREIGRNAGGIDDIVERELVHKRTGLQEEGEWLPALCSVTFRVDSLPSTFSPGQCRPRLP